jgi:hypothetical protein
MRSAIAGVVPYYDRTRPEEMFCTEAEARAAGERRAIVRQ